MTDPGQSTDSTQILPRGYRRDYALDPKPIALGGQAKVTGARHKASGRRVAVKQVRSRHPAALARMRREIEAGRRFGGRSHVMPVLDAGSDWFVMPLADATAEARKEQLADPTEARKLVNAVCEALREPHRIGWIHRDLNPRNVLLLERQWVVADWGLGRRPRGLTTDPRHTQTGGNFGTDGFAAPELYEDAHSAGPPADIYSIGRIVAWALTGTWPRGHDSLLPEGPWRAVVWQATHRMPSRRPGSVDDLLSLIASELDGVGSTSVERGRQLLASALSGDPAAPVKLLETVASYRNDVELIDGVLVRLVGEPLRRAVRADPAAARDVVTAMRAVAASAYASAADARIGWLLETAAYADALDDWDLLDGAVDGVVASISEATALPVRQAVGDWLATCERHCAATVAAALSREPAVARLFGDLTGSLDVDPRIRQALRSASGQGRDIADAADGGEANGPTSDGRAEGSRTSTAEPVAPAGPRTGGVISSYRRIIAVAAALVTAAGAALAVTLLPDGTGALDAPSVTNSPSAGLAGLPSTPSELADFDDMKQFVSGWDSYPSWERCRSGDGDTMLTGSFPASPATLVPPAHSFYCTNGGGLTLMFARFQAEGTYEAVVPRYFDAPAPDTVVNGERTPPDGTHVFAWSATERALVWADDEAGTIGVLVTDSGSADLVELWNRYHA